MQVHRFPPRNGAYALNSVPLELVPASNGQIGLCRFEKGMRSPVMGMRSSAVHELGYVISGRLRIETATDSYDVKAGDLLATSPAEEHSTTALEDSEIFFVLLDPK